MDFRNDKYEYLLQTKGGFYDKEYRELHHQKPGCFFFNSMDTLEQVVEKLRKMERDLNAYHLVTNIKEGRSVRYKTIAKMKLSYNGRLFEYKKDFGFAYPVESAYYMLKDGDLACDCNKSLLLKRKFGKSVEEIDCGETIQIFDLKVEQVRTGLFSPNISHWLKNYF